jgi:multidrug efflux pump subunit AcrB
MERLRHYADLSIRRGCSFGLLAIGTAVVGMASDMRLATKAAAIGMSLMVAILLLKAMQAPRRSYKRTELWILIDRKHGFPEARAQEVFGNILRERYFWHAEIAAIGAAALWLLSFVLHVWGRPPVP